MYISVYFLIPVVVLAVVGAMFLIVRIREDVNASYGLHCRRIYQQGHEAGKNGHDKWNYHPADFI